MVIDRDIIVGNIAGMRINQYSSPFVLEGNTQSCWTLYYVIDGEMKVVLGRRSILIKAGEIMVIAADEHHSIQVLDSPLTRVFTMEFEIGGAKSDQFRQLHIQLNPICSQTLFNIIEYADDVFNLTVETPLYIDLIDKRTTVSVMQILRTKIELFFLEILEHHFIETEQDSPHRLVRDQIILRTNEELRKHLKGNISLDELSKILNISKSYLCITYKKKTGKSIIAQYNEMKIEKAKQLIDSGKYNFTEVSEQLGFSSVHYFSRLFKETTKMTPSEYKKKSRVI